MTSTSVNRHFDYIDDRTVVPLFTMMGGREIYSETIEGYALILGALNEDFREDNIPCLFNFFISQEVDEEGQYKDQTTFYVTHNIKNLKPDVVRALILEFAGRLLGNMLKEGTQ